MTVSMLHIFNECPSTIHPASPCTHGVYKVYKSGLEKGAELGREEIEELIKSAEIVINESRCFKKQCTAKQNQIGLSILTISRECSKESKLFCNHSCQIIYKNGYRHMGEFNARAIKSLIKVSDFVENKSDCFSSFTKD